MASLSGLVTVTVPPLVVSMTVNVPVRIRPRTLTVPSRSNRTVASSACPPPHVAPTVYPPRPRSPCTCPLGQADGSAGRTCSSPLWLCSSISAMPEVAPKLPSIWNGGCRSNMFGASRAVRDQQADEVVRAGALLQPRPVVDLPGE